MKMEDKNIQFDEWELYKDCVREVRVVCREPGNYGLRFYDYRRRVTYTRFYKTERGMKCAWTRFMNKG